MENFVNSGSFGRFYGAESGRTIQLGGIYRVLVASMFFESALGGRRHTTNFYVGTSRDGDRWDLSWIYAEKPLMLRGPEGSWDKGCIWGPTSIVTWKDRHWLYYTGYDERHLILPFKVRLGLITLRLDGFVYLEPRIKEEPGWVITKPFRLEGGNLEVNVDAKRGWLAVEVLNADTGEPIPGFTRKESKLLQATDRLRLRPRWERQMTLATLRSEVLRLKFHLKNAKLYAFQVTS